MIPKSLKDAVHEIWRNDSQSPEIRVLAQAVQMLWQEIDLQRIADRKPTLPSPRVRESETA